MKALLITLLTACSFIIASAQDADKVKELEQRIQSLEARMAKIENNADQQTTQKKMMKVARQHMDAERKNFKSEDIAQAEEMYGKASRMLWSDESMLLLDSVVMMYPQLNRAGCAQLYRAQGAKYEEKERLLKDCIEHFSTCYYGDGAQVGPLAMLYLASYYQQVGREYEARELFKRIRNESPEAIGHDGELLVNKIDQ